MGRETSKPVYALAFQILCKDFIQGRMWTGQEVAYSNIATGPG